MYIYLHTHTHTHKTLSLARSLSLSLSLTHTRHPHTKLTTIQPPSPSHVSKSFRHSIDGTSPALFTTQLYFRL